MTDGFGQLMRRADEPGTRSALCTHDPADLTHGMAHGVEEGAGLTHEINLRSG